MSKIIGYLKQHIKADFNIIGYGSVLLFLSVAIYFNYKYGIENNIIDAYYGKEIRWLWYFLFYSFAYFGSLFIILIINKELRVLKKKDLYIYSIIGMAILSFDGSFYYHKLIADKLPAQLYHYAYKVLGDLNGMFATVMPLAVFYYFIRRPSESFYGLSVKSSVAFIPYLWLLLFMAPLITWASFQPDFLSSYPICNLGGAQQYLNIPGWILASIFEISYGLDFIVVELFFRGFLILGMVHILGKHAILPMVVTYAFLHFGKPLGETIGSVFGGYVLGVIALYSRNIWGGVAIHVGVAWLMELTAYLQKS